MQVEFRRRGTESWTTIVVDDVDDETESDTEIAEHVLSKYDPDGSGKIRLRGWTYHYDMGTIRRPRHC